jgi:hypothetical protein
MGRISILRLEQLEEERKHLQEQVIGGGGG